jgi:hypothetical protein
VLGAELGAPQATSWDCCCTGEPLGLTLGDALGTVLGDTLGPALGATGQHWEGRALTQGRAGCFTQCLLALTVGDRLGEELGELGEPLGTTTDHTR